MWVLLWLPLPVLGWLKDQFNTQWIFHCYVTVEFLFLAAIFKHIQKLELSAL